MSALNKKPNLIKYPVEELMKIIHEAIELQRQGKREESFKMKKHAVPLMAGSANFLKQEHGIQYLINEGFNLSEAVDTFGEKWLEK